MLFLPKFEINPVVVELFDLDGSQVYHLPRVGGLQAASTIKQRTFSSVVDNRIRLANSNFARPWSTDIGTSWSHIRICGCLGIELTGSDITSTPRFFFGCCSGTSNIFMDATTTHWAGAYSTWTPWAAGTNKYHNYTGGTIWTLAKRITSTTTTGSGLSTAWTIGDCTQAFRTAFLLDITKGSPFTVQLFSANAYNTLPPDVTLSAFLTQIPLTTPVFTSHGFDTAVTMTLDEATNGYFNAVNIGWDRTSPAIELSALAVVKLA